MDNLIRDSWLQINYSGTHKVLPTPGAGEAAGMTHPDSHCFQPLHHTIPPATPPSTLLGWGLTCQPCWCSAAPLLPPPPTQGLTAGHAGWLGKGSSWNNDHKSRFNLLHLLSMLSSMRPHLGQTLFETRLATLYCQCLLLQHHQQQL